MNPGERLYDVLRHVRPIHQASAKLVTDSLRDHPASMPIRAVLERLRDDGPQTVPQLARALWLSRQAVQKIVDDARALGYLELHPNPAHRRSHLVELTPAGAYTFAMLHRDELGRLAQIAEPLDPADIDACVRVLAHLSRSLRTLVDDPRVEPICYPGCSPLQRGRLMRLTLPDGHLWYERAGAGEPPVVLLHGGALDHRMWRHQIAHLRQHKLVVAPDARGHGRSSTPFTPFRQCDDVAALVEHLEAGPAVLVGVSMGAGAAVDTALEHPGIVKALVVSGAGTNEPTFNDPWILGIQDEWARAIEARDPAAWVEATTRFTAGPTRQVEQVDQEVVRLCRQMATDTLSNHVVPGAATPTPVRGSWERIHEIGVPVLGIAGGADSADHQVMVKQLVSGVRRGQMVTIDGTAHYPNLERPEVWNDLVDDFLASLVH